MIEKGDSVDKDNQPFDKFELFVAILLGMAALATAWSGYQSGLWGGNQATNYGLASKKATEASTVNSDMLIEMSHDLSIDVEAKKLIAEARDAVDEVDRARYSELASYLYLVQLSDDAYEALGLPVAVKEKLVKGSEDDVTLPPAALEQAFYTDLDDVYYDKKFAEVEAMFAEADKTFDEGQKANEIGDKFDLTTVIFTASLFFAGLGLVFKTRVRWGFFYLGSAIFLVGLIYMLTLKTAG